MGRKMFFGINSFIGLEEAIAAATADSDDDREYDFAIIPPDSSVVTHEEEGSDEAMVTYTLSRDVSGNIEVMISDETAKKIFSNKKGISLPRCIPLPKCGRLLPLISIFAGLSALGSLAGGAAGIAKAVNDSKAAQKSLQESKRHSRMIEAVALGKRLYIKPHKQGAGLYLNPSKN
ncbi:unnamed protein product [Parnassius apollo]|uniref:(apollo) hypothetical protein n=1 Tax=Parnassius apollo TaxID=110799 RepID=A0A8S3X6K2_PARAO|nr:unnamed protein product [Parnassius apollo]